MSQNFVISINDVIVKPANVHSKDDALRVLADLMQKQGYVKQGYYESMKNRDADVSTYMENGVAIPHGERTANHLIIKTGITVMTLENGIAWQDGEEPVRLIFALSADGDEHLQLLGVIAQIFGDKNNVNELVNCSNANDLIKLIENKYINKPTNNSDSQGSVGKLAGKVFVGISACPTGIAHTYMAQGNLEKVGRELGAVVHIETQGSGGAKNIIPNDLLQKADAVILATDINVTTERFGGKRVLFSSTKQAIHNAEEVFEQALHATVFKGTGNGASASSQNDSSSSDGSSIGSDIYKHLMSGVSHMLPFVVAGGILIALAFAVGGIHAGDDKGSLGAALMQIGGGGAFALMVPFLSAYIAYSIADRSGLTPGAVSGILAMQIGAGFIGGLIGGFLAGYIAKFIRDRIPLPMSLEALKPIVITPLVATGITGLLMIYVIGEPASYILTGLSNFLTGMKGSSALMLGLVIGVMMGTDLGGPVNKAAYTFSVGLLSNGVYEPIAIAMAAGMVPPLAIAVARYIAPHKFTAQERDGGIATALLGLSFISEGAIPYTAADPARMIPANIIGTGVTGALVGIFGIALHAPHGGIFVVAIPNAVDKPLLYILSIAVGVIVQAVIMAVIRKRVS